MVPAPVGYSYVRSETSAFSTFWKGVSPDLYKSRESFSVSSPMFAYFAHGNNLLDGLAVGVHGIIRFLHGGK